MDDSQILSELLKENVIIQHYQEYHKNCVKLEEEGLPESTSILRNLPHDAVVIKADQFPAPRDYFKGDKSENKRADFIIISPSKKVVIYIELKAGNKQRSYVENQLKGAACVFAYCKEVGHLFWNHSTFLEGYKHRFVGIVNTSINLKPSRTQKNGNTIHDTPSKFLKISAPHNLQYNQLAALHYDDQTKN